MKLSDALTKISKQLEPKIDDALTKEVFKEVQDEEAATVYSEVYKVYTPRMYRRRGEYGGLGDPYNIEIRGGVAKKVFAAAKYGIERVVGNLFSPKM